MKRRRIVETWNGVDRISELPDAILTHILSFVDTKMAVQTCLLSKRWKNLWTSLTCLSFRYTRFRNFSLLRNFIDQVVNRRDKSVIVDKFIYSSKRDSISLASFEKICNYATSNGTKHLELSVRRKDTICSIPNSILSAMSLRILKIKAIGCPISIDTQLCLKQLELLHLEGIYFEASDIFSQCENLVDLSIVDCCYYKSLKGMVIISAPRLARLSISSNNWNSEMLEFVISLRKLTSLSFRASRNVAFRTDKLLHLQTARIDLYSAVGTKNSVNEERMSRIAMNMVRELHNAQHVYLSTPTIKLLHVIAGTTEVSPVQFVNLKTLTIFRQKRTSSLISPHKHISSSVINQVLRSILQYSLDADCIIKLPRRVRSSCKV